MIRYAWSLTWVGMAMALAGGAWQIAAPSPEAAGLWIVGIVGMVVFGGMGLLTAGLAWVRQ